MKKSQQSLVYSALLAISASSYADSSVSLFGVMDMNIRHVKNNSSVNQLGQDGIRASRFGLRGTEDLGQGYKASFHLEAAMGVDTGTGSASIGNGSSSGLAFRRRSTVSLHGPWGELRLGRAYTPTFWIWTVDPFDANGLGDSSNLFLDARATAASGGSYGTFARANNSVGYHLPPNLGGIYGDFMVAAAEGVNGNGYVGGRIGYKTGKLDVESAYGKTKVNVATNAQAHMFNVGGSYDMDFAKWWAFASRLSISPFAQTNYNVGATLPITGTASQLKVSAGRMTGRGNLSATQMALGAQHNLSKRTALYTTVARINNKNTAFKMGPSASELDQGRKSSGFDVGLRHIF